MVLVTQKPIQKVCYKSHDTNIHEKPIRSLTSLRTSKPCVQSQARGSQISTGSKTGFRRSLRGPTGK
ncbi:hypothetical protein M407DRAFT_244985 [Tulasnella calospora MUT 4182]|uniref:Uncharacterized protein n=1 Tax=Tulasnella calospora MUT 4182 TaxID=1051891 RepID=A0A0C3QDP0_9AGAM|nr:hypothetical protein M407DRAFT_244985 [Tulasnella calospora MUT 4182]